MLATLSLLAGVLTSSLFPQAALADTASIVMHPGSVGSDVSTLQTDLQELGYFPKSESITQYFGPVTSHAVITFKVDHKLGKRADVTEPVFTAIKTDAAVAPKRSSQNDPLADRIIATAKNYLGDPYVWGGNSPAGFDCSGFTQYVFAQLGINLPHSASAQATLGTPVSEADLQPGDLVFFDTSGGISHVGIYIGDGKFINAASTDVEVDSIHDPFYWASRYLFARRIT